MTCLPWIHDDGGRAAAGYRGTTRDCVVRAIAIAVGVPYRDVYEELHDLSRAYAARGTSQAKLVGDPSPRTGVLPRIYRPYLEDRWGAVWTPLMRIGGGCEVHLAAGEVPARGRYVVRLTRHLTALVDGVVHDTYDPARDGTRCVYGHWRVG